MFGFVIITSDFFAALVCCFLGVFHYHLNVLNNKMLLSEVKSCIILHTKIARQEKLCRFPGQFGFSYNLNSLSGFYLFVYNCRSHSSIFQDLLLACIRTAVFYNTLKQCHANF